MPSDVRQDRDAALDGALRAVGGALESFRSAVARTVDDLRSELAERGEPAEVRQRRVAELGPMASGRIDAERWSALLDRPRELDPDAGDQLADALRVLEEIEDAGTEPFVVRVELGAALDGAARDGLARLGRAFGAARTAELVRTGRFRPEDHGDFVRAFPPGLWNRREREVAPPLVIRVEGADLRPAGLAACLDGSQKLVLLVDGAAPPASLVRLVTPGAWVAQTDDPAGLAAMDEVEGPAVAALFEEGAEVARFVHDPAGGDAPARRLIVEAAPEASALRPVGSWTLTQQREELGQLRALAGAAAAPESPSENGTGGDVEGEEAEPADRLAAWLLRQANLTDLNGGA